MSVSFDFQIISKTGVPGVSMILAQNEDAFSYLTEEMEMPVQNDGTTPIASDDVGDFINDAEWAHLCSHLI